MQISEICYFFSQVRLEPERHFCGTANKQAQRRDSKVRDTEMYSGKLHALGILLEKPKFSESEWCSCKNIRECFPGLFHIYTALDNKAARLSRLACCFRIKPCFKGAVYHFYKKKEFFTNLLKLSLCHNSLWKYWTPPPWATIAVWRNAELPVKNSQPESGGGP